MKPILFNTEMVRAILDGRKTVMRRVVKPQLKGNMYPMPMVNEWPNYYGCTGIEELLFPPYHPNDILYVRETWCKFDADHIINGMRYAYKANSTSESERVRKDFGYKWRPSIHMPREAARIFLRVTDVRVERLKDMQPYDIAFEGFRRQRDFIALWNSTLKPADRALYGWDANPWVWVIEFERIDKKDIPCG